MRAKTVPEDRSGGDCDVLKACGVAKTLPEDRFAEDTWRGEDMCREDSRAQPCSPDLLDNLRGGHGLRKDFLESVRSVGIYLSMYKKLLGTPIIHPATYTPISLPPRARTHERRRGLFVPHLSLTGRHKNTWRQEDARRHEDTR